MSNFRAVNVIERNTEIVNKHLRRYTAVTTTLTVAVVGHGTESTITVASATGFSVGDSIHINGTGLETTEPIITAINGLVFTLDRPLDAAHAIGSDVTQSIINMALAVGTLAAPLEYFIAPPAGEIWQITRLLFSMTHPSAGDLGTFGNLTALTNGVILRVERNGVYRTLTNWKTNADIKEDMFDITFDIRSGGGSYGTSGRGTFAKSGSILELNGDTLDKVEIYIQDDITALTHFTMKMQGHVN
jgi:hypothetical protein